MTELPHTHSCFVCGDINPIGLNLRFYTNGKIVRTEFSFRPEHIGFQQTVHGGLISTLLDEVMVWACAVATKRFAFCAELSTRFLKPVRPAIPLVGCGELAADRRGRIFEAKSELLDSNGALLATATGKYFPLKDADAAEMSRDLVGMSDWLSSSGTAPAEPPLT
jgi:acyl-coenzyme A thioesterase PaaI-like protein